MDYIIAKKKRVCVKVPVVNTLPEGIWSVVATGFCFVPRGYVVCVDKSGRLFAIKDFS